MEKNKITHITKVEIKELWGDPNLNFEWNLNRDVNILAGDNGSGKTTVLAAMVELLQKKTSESYNYSDTQSNIHFDNEKNIKNFFIDISKLPKVSYIATFDQKLKPKEAVDKITDNQAKTDLDFQVFQLQSQYKDYQINIGKRAIDALANGLNNIKAIAAKRDLFFDTMDNLFADKRVDRDKNEIIFLKTTTLGDSITISPYQLSSGEKQMLVILLTALVQDNQPAIMIMDEPEVSLHTDWQKNLIDNIRQLNENVQIIIATHSPAIVVKGWRDKVFEMSEILVKNNDAL